MIIAIDGPAGAGKSTVCRLIAERLGFLYLDTGAMYRAVAWALEQESPGFGEDRLPALLSRIPLWFAIRGGALEIHFGSRVLDAELRGPEISEEASRVSRFQAVRSYLVQWQRRLAQMGDVVVEGRDTATVVFPDADVKVFLTADLATRAERRRKEYELKGILADFDEILERVRSRDEADQKRALAPLRPAEGAVLFDTSKIGISEVVEKLLDIIKSRIGAKCASRHED